MKSDLSSPGIKPAGKSTYRATCCNIVRALHKISWIPTYTDVEGVVIWIPFRGKHLSPSHNMRSTEKLIYITLSTTTTTNRQKKERKVWLRLILHRKYFVKDLCSSCILNNELMLAQNQWHLRNMSYPVKIHYRCKTKIVIVHTLTSKYCLKMIVLVQHKGSESNVFK